MNILILAFGSNIGKGEDMINTAIAKLAISNFDLIAHSNFYKTKPLVENGYIDPTNDMPLFTNSVAAFYTSLSPDETLDMVKKIETELGRVARPKWNKREIDIDIILYNKIKIKTQFLTIPHPEFYRRSFVIEPLKEICNQQRLLKDYFDDFISPLII
jgi:2-amino-4-hydroxy-6-hydroxymethyldihydropteridine diphosphokinase